MRRRRGVTHIDPRERAYAAAAWVSQRRNAAERAMADCPLERWLAAYAQRFACPSQGVACYITIHAHPTRRHRRR